ncbi:MAG: hypothetical protein KGL12_04295 [Rhodospirillales bacterium]|nr:hypothetical protein [Rhodospirillales bacterium]
MEPISRSDPDRPPRRGRHRWLIFFLTASVLAGAGLAGCAHGLGAGGLGAGGDIAGLGWPGDAADSAGWGWHGSSAKVARDVAAIQAGIAAQQRRDSLGRI